MWRRLWEACSPYFADFLALVALLFVAWLALP
jgi:hypothetical protein